MRSNRVKRPRTNLQLLYKRRSKIGIFENLGASMLFFSIVPVVFFYSFHKNFF
jgi:hypothetical protein